MELDRRDFLKLSGALTFTIAAGGCATSGPADLRIARELLDSL